MSSSKFETKPKPSGKQIRKALIDLDMSVMELATAMQVSPYYIREIYAERRVARDMRKRIARHLKAEYQKRNYSLPRWASIKEKVA
ncbi:MAG: hypothetical protein PHO32_07045 [Candidatus Cloacimonetes bacterium]|nr:hypothetical protein [Candidatus Cloacimonadota bacterium]